MAVWLVGALLHLGTMEGNECRGEDERKEASVLTRGQGDQHSRLSFQHRAHWVCGGPSILLTVGGGRWEEEEEK